MVVAWNLFFTFLIMYRYDNVQLGFRRTGSIINGHYNGPTVVVNMCGVMHTCTLVTA